MQQWSKYLYPAILFLIGLGVAILYSATKHRFEADRIEVEEKIKLASLAAKSIFELELEHYSRELVTGVPFVSWDRSESLDEPFFTHFSLILDNSEELKSVCVTRADGLSAQLVLNRSGVNITRPQGLISDSLFKVSDSRWFSQALKSGGRTAWTVEQDSTGQSIVASILIPSLNSKGQLSVLALKYDAHILVSSMRRVPSRVEGISVIQFSDGSFALPKGEENNVELLDLCKVVSALSDSEIHSKMFDVRVNDLTYKAFIAALGITGLEPSLMTIIPQENPGYFQSMNVYIISGFLLLLVLGALLTAWWLRGRMDKRRLSIQQERSKNQQRKLEQVIGERQVLDREVHHRVKNNLQIISSLLNMQLMRPDIDKNDSSALTHTKRRIEAIGALHNAIYDAKDLRGISMDEFLSSLAHWINKNYSPPGVNVSYEVDANGITLDMDTALDVGMITMELVVNAHQHGFPRSVGGHVDIKLFHEKRKRYKLQVYDNGIGMGAELLDRKETYRMGMDLVDALVEGLEGTFSYRSDEGVKCDMTMRFVQRESLERPQ